MLAGKRGLEMVFSSIVMLILAIFLVSILILFLTGGFKNFQDKVGFYSPKSNVDSIVDNCNLLVQQNSVYEYCCINKTIIIPNKQKFELSCFDALNQNWSSNRINKLNCGDIC